MNRFELIKMRRENQDKCFSDLIDERQVRDSIPLNQVIAIGIPYQLKSVDCFYKLSSFTYLSLSEYQEFLKQIETYAKEIGSDIVDSSNPTFPLS